MLLIKRFFYNIFKDVSSHKRVNYFLYKVIISFTSAVYSYSNRARAINCSALIKKLIV